MSESKKGFTWGSKSYYWKTIQTQGVIDDFAIGKYFDDGGCEFEFTIKFYEYGMKIGVFDDALQSIELFKDLFHDLIQRGSGGTSPDQLFDILQSHGFHDMTRREIPEMELHEKRQVALEKLTDEERLILGVSQ